MNRSLTPKTQALKGITFKEMKKLTKKQMKRKHYESNNNKHRNNYVTYFSTLKPYTMTCKRQQRQRKWVVDISKLV